MKKSLLFLTLSLTLVSCGVDTKKNAGPQQIALISPDNKVVELTVEVADDPAEREKGLMGRTELAEGTGMLFLFDESGVLTFWMKDTLIPLDILFFDQLGQYLSSTTMTPCTADPCTLYGSVQPARIALEVPAGFLQKHRVGTGWRIALPVPQE